VNASRLSRAAVAAVLLAGCGIKQRLAPNTPDAEGFTPLMRAAERDDVREIRALVRRGADPNYQGREVKTYGLLFPFVSVEWKDVPKESWTPLMVAAQAGHAEAIRALIAVGANPNEGTRLGRSGTTALWFAAHDGHRAAAEALLDGEASATSWPTHQALATAVAQGHVDLARAMARRGAGVRVVDPHMPISVTGWSSPITEAARAGHADLVDDLLAAGLDVSADRGGTPLRAAAAAGQERIVRSLLRAGARPDASGLPVFATPLLLAAGGGHSAIVEALLENGAKTEAVHGQSGATPLIVAAERGHHDVVRVLLRHGANVEARDRRGMTAMARAAERADRAMQALLQEAGASPGEAYSPELLQAVQRGDLRATQELLARKAPPDLREGRDHRTMLMLAAGAGRRDLMAVLLKAGADPNARDASGQVALQFAVIGGHLDVVEDLLAAGARVPAEPRSNPLPYAVATGKAEIARLLAAHADEPARLGGLRTASEKGDAALVKALGRGMSPASLGLALVDAAREGKAVAAKELLAAGASPDAADERGVTALMWAAYHGDVDTIRTLAAAGADVNARLTDWKAGDARLPRATAWNAVFWAACEEHTEAVRALVELGVDVNVKNSRNQTALECAADRGDFEAVEILRKAGAVGVVDDRKVRTAAILRASWQGRADRVRRLLAMGVSARSADEYGLTPLHEAARWGRPEVVKLLLDAGADPSARRRDGSTPLWYAEQGGDKAVVALLVSAGAVSKAPGSQGQ
jgi:ankyrin repeat protein